MHTTCGTNSSSDMTYQERTEPNDGKRCRFVEVRVGSAGVKGRTGTKNLWGPNQDLVDGLGAGVEFLLKPFSFSE